MSTKDPQSTRKILRKAEGAFDDPEAQEKLAKEGIHLGETEELGRDELLALFDEGSDSEDSGPTVTITCYFEDTPVEDRSEIEEPLASFVEDSGLGEWVGSGQGSIGERAFFDVTFEVHDLDQALLRIQAKLRELNVGAQTEVEASDGRKLPLKASP